MKKYIVLLVLSICSGFSMCASAVFGSQSTTVLHGSRSGRKGAVITVNVREMAPSLQDIGMSGSLDDVSDVQQEHYIDSHIELRLSPQRSMRRTSRMKMHPTMAPDVINAWQAEQQVIAKNPALRFSIEDELFSDDFKISNGAAEFASTSDWQYTMGRNLLDQEADPREVRQLELAMQSEASLRRSDARVEEQERTHAQKCCAWLSQRFKK